MAIQTERRYAGEFILSEAAGYRSRDEAVIAPNQTLKAGQVLGQITQGTKTAVGAAGVPAPAGATITAAPTAAKNAKLGVHRFECIVGGAGSASRWRHTDPDGVVVGVAQAGTEYSGGGLSGITIADDGADPTPGEAFTVTVSVDEAASGYYVAHDPTAIDGSEVAAGLIHDDVTTGGQAGRGVVIARDAEVREDRLVWGEHNAGQKAAAIADLKRLGIIVRS